MNLCELPVRNGNTAKTVEGGNGSTVVQQKQSRVCNGSTVGQQLIRNIHIKFSYRLSVLPLHTLDCLCCPTVLPLPPSSVCAVLPLRTGTSQKLNHFSAALRAFRDRRMIQSCAAPGPPTPGWEVLALRKKSSFLCSKTIILLGRCVLSRTTSAMRILRPVHIRARRIFGRLWIGFENT